jgi:hypothetical protein
MMDAQRWIQVTHTGRINLNRSGGSILVDELRVHSILIQARASKLTSKVESALVHGSAESSVCHQLHGSHQSRPC